METHSRIYVAGHTGLVGSSIVRELRKRGHSNVILRTHPELDLRDQSATQLFFEGARPEYVFLAAAKVGGIQANNTYRGEFLFDNLAIQMNVIESARRVDVKKLVFLGSSCIYPKECPQPIREDYLLTGPLEATNEPYAIAKIAGLKMCEAYRSQYGFQAISVMPTNLYGPGDSFDLQNGHVLPSLIRKFHEAKVNGSSEVVIWGSGRPRREFLYSEDLADAVVFLMNVYDGDQHLNVGTGEDITIADLAKLVGEVVGYSGKTVMNDSKPDGVFRKQLDVSKLKALGWQAKTSLREGIVQTYESFLTSNQ